MSATDEATAQAGGAGPHLRLVYPQWQGAGADIVELSAPEFPLDVARRGYAWGSRVLQAVLPEHTGPTEIVPVEMSDRERATRDGLEGKGILLEQQRAALELVERHRPARITTLGGDCSVSVAPFSALASRYGDDLAVLWIDAHPDTCTDLGPGTPGFHARAVTTLIGEGDPDIRAGLPAHIDRGRLALVGMHSGTAHDHENIARWGLRSFSPRDLRDSSGPLLDWLAGTGCGRVAIHFDVDAIDGDEHAFGLVAEPRGLATRTAARLIAEVGAAAEVVGFTVAEFIPRQVMRLRETLIGLDPLGGAAADDAAASARGGEG